MLIALPDTIGVDEHDDEEASDKTRPPRCLAEEAENDVGVEEDGGVVGSSLTCVILYNVRVVEDYDHDCHRNQLDLEEELGKDSPFVGENQGHYAENARR